MMKVHHFLLFLAFLAISKPIFAQKGTNVLKLGGQSTLYDGSISNGTPINVPMLVASYEYAVTKRGTAILNFDYGKKDYSTSFLSGTVESKLKLTNLELEARHYFRMATRGFYMGAGLGVSFVDEAAVVTLPNLGMFNVDLDDVWYNITAKTGYQFHISSKLAIQLGAFVGRVYVPALDANNGKSFWDARGGFSLQLGYRF